MLSFVAVQSTLCYPMDFSTPRSSVLHDLPEFAQIHVHWISYVTISSSTTPFSFCLQSFPASGSFLMSWIVSGGQSIGASDSASILPKINPGWFPLGLTGLISLQSKGLLKSLLQHHSSEILIFWNSAFFIVQFSHLCMTTGKTMALTRWTFVGKVMSVLFNKLSAAAAAKSLQSCPTLCDPIDGSPPGSPVPWILCAAKWNIFLRRQN